MESNLWHVENYKKSQIPKPVPYPHPSELLALTKACAKAKSLFCPTAGLLPQCTHIDFSERIGIALLEPLINQRHRGERSSTARRSSCSVCGVQRSGRSGERGCGENAAGLQTHTPSVPTATRIRPGSSFAATDRRLICINPHRLLQLALVLIQQVSASRTNSKQSVSANACALEVADSPARMFLRGSEIGCFFQRGSQLAKKLLGVRRRLKRISLLCIRLSLPKRITGSPNSKREFVNCSPAVVRQNRFLAAPSNISTQVG